MKRVLVVGYMPLEEKKKLARKWDNCVLIFTSALFDTDRPEVVIETAKMIDAVLVTKQATREEKLCWEVACVMCEKEIKELKDEVDDDGESV